MITPGKETPYDANSRGMLFNDPLPEGARGGFTIQGSISLCVLDGGFTPKAPLLGGARGGFPTQG